MPTFQPKLFPIYRYYLQTDRKFKGAFVFDWFIPIFESGRVEKKSLSLAAEVSSIAALDKAVDQSLTLAFYAKKLLFFDLPKDNVRAGLREGILQGGEGMFFILGISTDTV